MLAVLGVLLLLLVIFYRPIFFALAHYAVGKVGGQQGLKIEYQAGGSILGGLNLKNVHVTPTKPGPLEKADIGELELSYGLPSLIRGGVSGTWLKEVKLKDANIVYDPNREPPSPPKKKEPFKLPPIPFPGKITLQNVNVEVRATSTAKAEAAGQNAAASSNVPAPLAPAVAQATTAVAESGLKISNLNLQLDPDRPGKLHIDQLRIPGGPDLKNINADTSYKDRDLELTNLELDKNFKLRRLGIDASQIGKELLTVNLDGDVFAGRAVAKVQLQGIGKPPRAHVELALNDLSLGALRDFIKLDSPLDGRVDSLTLNFDGESDHPRTWDGRLELHARDPLFGPAKLDRADALLVMAKGNADLQQLQVTQAANVIAAKAVIALPENIADLPRSAVRGDVKITAPDFASLPVKLPETLGLRGAFDAAGPFALADGKLTATLAGKAHNVATAQPDASVDGADFTLNVVKTLPADATAPPSTSNATPPPPKPFFDGLNTKLNTTLNHVRYGPYVLDRVTLGAVSVGPDARVETLDVTRGANTVHAAARYALPPPGADAAKQPLTADLDINAPDLSQFSTDLSAEPLAGRLSAKGHVETQNGAYRGGLDLNARDVLARGLKVQTADAQISVADALVSLKALSVRLDEKNAIDAAGQFGLDGAHPFSGNVNVNLPDLAALAPALRANGVNQPIAGSLRLVGNGQGRLGTGPADRKVDANVELTARDLVAAGVRVAGADAKVVVANNEATIQSGQIRFDEKNVIGIGGKVGLAGEQPFNVNVNADFPSLAGFEPALRANKINEPITGSARLEFRAAGLLSAPPAAASDAKAAPRVDDGQLILTAHDVSVRGQRAVQSLDGRVVIEGTRARVQTFVLRFDDKNTVNLDGQATLATPFPYNGSLSADLNDLRSFQPLLRAFSPPPKETAATKLEPAVKKKTGTVTVPPKPRQLSAADLGGKNGGRGRVVPGAATATGVPAKTPEQKLAGAVNVRWQGQGQLAPATASTETDASQISNLTSQIPSVPPPLISGQPGISNPKSQISPAHTGNASVTVRAVEFNAIGPVDADLAGRYATPEPFELPTFSVRLNGLELKATLAFANGLLRLDNLHLVQNGTDLLAGYVQIPLHPGDPAGIVPDIPAIDVNVASKPLPIPLLFSFVDKTKPAPAQGTVSLAVNAKGSLSKIVADLRVQGRDLRPTQSLGLAPATLDVDLNLRDDRLNLVASLLQPQFNALQVKGNVPLNLNAILRDGKLDPKSPVQLTVSLPRSDLGFLAKLAPQVGYVNGSAAADVRVAGTIENPTFAGSVDLNVPAVRSKNITIPRVSDLVARLTFTQRQLLFERLGGNLGGGRFDVNGRVDFAKLTAADTKLDLTLKATDVLAFRDDNTTARINADVRVAGPLNTAAVTGSVGLTKSRFLKDIDILPLNLPGKPAPAPPAAAQDSGPQTISVDTPPVRDWKFDLRIRTDDPFLVRGNLANGQALVDLTLKGTGAKPLLAGFVTVENLKATLPFSRLEISNGNIQFTPDQPLNPLLDLRGTSTIRERIVTVYISGRARDPKTQFSSEPPLPQEQIVSLLVTGATTQELTGNSQALAGKATLLVLQDLYRRNFKKKGRVNDNPEPSLADRVDLDVGNVDPRTGRQQVSGRFKITDNVSFIGDFGIEGDLRGRVKYLLRFR